MEPKPESKRVCHTPNLHLRLGVRLAKLFKIETEIPQMAPLRYPQDRGYCETLIAHDRGVIVPVP